MEARLHSLDFVVIAAYFVGMLAVGAYYARRSRTATDYLLGGRTMRPLEALEMKLEIPELTTRKYQSR